ncbi:MAG: 6-hydroxymethylpterin diphosphokinase MptE-like protein [Thermodesulfobacteriota bacterium]
MKFLAVFQELGLLAVASRSAGRHEGGEGGHAYHHHAAMWDYCDPSIARPFAAAVQAPPVFSTPPPGTALDEAMRLTRLLVFLGAEDSPQFRAALARPEGVCLVFEPDLDRLDRYLSGLKPHALAGKGVFFVGGDPDALDVPLLSMLPEDLCEQGYPLFFQREGLADALPEYARRVEELVELFYYRNVIYALESQENIRGLPLRPMVRDAIYDRFKHHYENLEPCLRSGTLSDLLGAFTGHAAILCAAGPALAQSLDFIRANSDRALVIAVNSAVKPLLAAGIRPHFVVINDTSIGSEPTLAGLPPMDGVTLVPHCLSTTGGGSFGDIRFFGNFPGQPFPKRDSLLLHGSVITTAFALAEYMGCVKAVLAGVQLSSPDPYCMNYAAGSQHEAHASGARGEGLSRRWPELYPVTAADGSRMFTTLNFLDAAQWFADRIRQASLEVINLCPASILRGPGIAFDPSPGLPEAPSLAGRLEAIPRSDFSERAQRVLDYIRQEMTRWKTKQRAAREAGGSLEAARDFIAASDLDNSSFMLQRFGTFDNARFHAAWFEGSTLGQRMDGARHFLEHMEAMCSELLRLLVAQHKAISDSHRL